MADQKVWHVLRQTIYLPPKETVEQNQEIRQSGSICLGDILQDLDHLDQRINEDGPVPYPLNMPIYKPTTSKFKWSKTENGEWHLSAGVDVSVPQVPGLMIGADLKAAMKSSVGRFYDIERLEANFIQPRTPYLNAAMEDPCVEKWLQRHMSPLTKSWKFYMITGLLIARGKKTNKAVESNSSMASGGFKASVQPVAEGHAQAGRSTEQETKFEAGGMDDFIWAIRLAKVSKKWPEKEWSIQTHFKDAVFEEREHEGEICDVNVVKNMLETEALRDYELLGGQETGSAFFVIRPRLE